MAESNAVHIIEAVYEGFRVRDMPKIFSLLSPEIELTQSDVLPWGGVYHGHEGARQFFRKLGAHLNSTLSLDRLIDSGDHVAAVGWTEGAVKETGAAYRVPIVHLWTVKDGAVTQVQFFIDHPTMLKSLAAR